ncbi:hypothetical protein ABZ851_15145 [Streptomyces sp. NPDC047049]|uniref:hypothetical protein n=1 Tax=Streptomyces sp. NPDC047049 TaxID=3156688 RepID=UPI0033DA057D
MSWNEASEVDADVNHTAASPATVGSALRRGRRIAAASLIAVAALSLTACGSGSDDTKASTKVSSRPDPNDLSKEAAALGNVAEGPGTKDKSAPSPKPSDTGKSNDGGSGAGSGKTSRGSGTSGNHGTGGTSGAGSDSGSTDGTGPAPDDKGVSGTWNGVLKYLTPGKMIVAPDSGAEQRFAIGPQTKALGAAAMCGGPDGDVTMDKDGYGTSPCTESQLDEAARMNSLNVRVTVEDGVATKVAEHYHP